MDRVEKALDRARLLREGGEKPPVSMPGSVRPPPDRPSRPPSIIYDRTRQEKIPQKALERARLIAGATNDWRANAFKVLRAQVLQQLSRDGLKTVGITSATPGDGKTLIAANLAISIAMDMNQTVLLVDLDLRRARLASGFGLQPEHGLSDYLLEACELEDCLVNPGIDRLVLLPERSAASHSSELLSSPRMKSMMQEVRDRYADRLVLYDLPPLFAGDDALVIAPTLDAILLVAQAGKTKKEEIETSLDLLKDCNVIGTVLNKGEYKEKYYYQ